jgi:hypothetical protein
VHPIWWGALAFLLLSLATTWMVLDAFIHFSWQDDLGAWTSWGGTVLAVSIVIPLRLWTTSAYRA